MTTQAGAAVATAAEQPPTPKRVRGERKIGDLLLRIVAGLVLLYLFLPIFVIILFSFNKPAGQVQLHVAGLHPEQLGTPVQVSGADRRVEAEHQHRRRFHRDRPSAWDAARHRPRAPTVPRPERRRHLSCATAYGSRGGDRRRAAHAVPRSGVASGLHHHRDRPRGIRDQLHRDDRARAGCAGSTGRWRTLPWTSAPAQPARSSK